MEENLHHEGNNEMLLPTDDDSIDKDFNLKPVRPPCFKDTLLSAGHVASHIAKTSQPCIAGEMPCRKKQLIKNVISYTTSVQNILP